MNGPLLASIAAVSADDVEPMFLTTHNRGKAAKVFQALGHELEFDTGHNSGQLRDGTGPYVSIAEVVRDPDGRRWSLQAPGAPT